MNDGIKVFNFFLVCFFLNFDQWRIFGNFIVTNKRSHIRKMWNFIFFLEILNFWMNEKSSLDFIEIFVFSVMELTLPPSLNLSSGLFSVYQILFGNNFLECWLNFIIVLVMGDRLNLKLFFWTQIFYNLFLWLHIVCFITFLFYFFFLLHTLFL